GMPWALGTGPRVAPDALPGRGDASVDGAVPDPPYDARTHRAALGGSKAASMRCISGALPFPPLDARQLEEVAGHLARITRRWIIVFSAERHLETWACALEAGAPY